jgi:membrane-associated phospholipid phosphatase
MGLNRSGPLFQNAAMAVAVKRAPRHAPVDRHRWLRVSRDWAGPAAYLGLLGVWIAATGLPTARLPVAFWLMAGMLSLSLRDLRRWISGVAFEWFPFVSFLFIYDIARSFANRLMPTNVHVPIDGDRLLFGGRVPTVWLQEHLWHGVNDVRWYDYAAFGVYMTYFFATLVVAAGLWVFAYHRFRRYVAAVGLLTIAGFLTYVLFPAAPPWYASSHGALAPSERLTGIVWAHTLPGFSEVVRSSQALVNPVAAVPSLHAGFTLLIALSLWRSARWWGRIPLAAYPLLMGFALVYFAEHYVVDILAGWVYALCVYVTVEWFAARRATIRSRLTAEKATSRNPHTANPLSAESSL